MGSYKFRWGHVNDVVYVTGSFDNWSQSVKLDKKDHVHEKLVHLPTTGEKILYKFVADDEWKHDPTAQTETDGEGNVNNVLYPDDLAPGQAMDGGVTTSSVAPGATTTELAGKQPLESEQNSTEKSERNSTENDLPGAFPETPAATAAEEQSNPLGGGALAPGSQNEEDQTFSVNPIPASEGASNPVTLAPGEKVPDPSTISRATVSSTVHDDPWLENSAHDSEQTFRVAPLPATGGIGNPVHLQPGEEVPDPSTITRNTVGSNVRLDKESYERADGGAAVHPVVATSETERSAAGGELAGGHLGVLGPQTTNMIPESSLGMGEDAPGPLDGVAINSVGANSTTNDLAGQVPIEPRGGAAGATINSVGETSTTNQLAGQVPIEPRGGAIGATINSVGETSTTNQLAGQVPIEPRGGAIGATINSVGEASTTNQLAGQVPLEVKGVPEIVSESQKEAGQAPEAAANPTAVEEKKEVEDELKKEVPEEPATSDGKNDAGIAGAVTKGVAVAGAVAAGAAAVAANMIKETTGKDPTTVLPGSIQKAIVEQNAASGKDAAALPATNTAKEVPSEVKDSQKQAHADPEASANPEAVHEKADVEKELLSKVPESQASGEPAPTVSAATAATAPTSSTGAPQLADPTAGVAALSLDDKSKGSINTPANSQEQSQAATTPALATEAGEPGDNRAVSPTSQPVTAGPSTTDQTAPEVTTAVDSGKVPEQSAPLATPSKNASTTPGKRSSIIDRLKGTPDSNKAADSTGATKKKGLFSKIKEKLKQ